MNHLKTVYYFLTIDIVHHHGYVLPEGEVIFKCGIARIYQ